MECNQLCHWNDYDMGCLKPTYAICPLSNMATQEKQLTNADRIRAMSDEELAEFLADRLAKESCHRLKSDGHMLTATQIEEIRNVWYCYWMQWLQQPAAKR